MKIQREENYIFLRTYFESRKRDHSKQYHREKMKYKEIFYIIQKEERAEENIKKAPE